MNIQLRSHMYRWRGYDKHGQKIQGQQQAIHPSLLKLELLHQGITVTAIRKLRRSALLKRSKTSPRDISLFIRQLATMITAGLPITQALMSLAQHQKPLASVIADVHQSVQQGTTLAHAFAKHPQIFNTLFTGLIHAGEQAGALDLILLRLAHYSEQSQHLRTQIYKVLYYPITVIAIALLISLGLLIFIVPSFAKIFANLGATLPLPTQIILVISKLLGQYSWFVLTITIAFVWLARRFYRDIAKFKKTIDRYFLRLPLLGQIIQKIVLARMIDTLAITFAAGMPVPEALNIIANTTRNTMFITAIHGVQQQILSGQRMAYAMQQYAIFPPLTVQMVAIGEESGTLEKMLTKLGEHYHEQVDTAVSQLSTMIEPLLMVILGILIGSLIIAMYLPIFQMGGILSGG